MRSSIKKLNLLGSLTAAYLFISLPALAVINPADVIIASDGSSTDKFGWSVAIDGNTAIVGAYQDDRLKNGVLTTDTGSAYIYVNDGFGNWTEQQKLTAS